MTGARLGLLLLVACGPQGAGSAEPPAASDPQGMAAAAERLMVSSLELDYDAPMRAHAGIAMRERAIEMYLGACRAGDRPSCWHAAHVQPPKLTGKARREALWLVGRNCLAGDAMSCRALTADEFRQFGFDERATEACQAGLAAGCENAAELEALRPGADPWQARRPWLEHGCTLGDARSCRRLAALAAEHGMSSLVVERWQARALVRSREECTAGVARSCELLQQLVPRDRDAGARMVAAADEGCRAGLIDECKLLGSPATEDRALRIHGMGRYCAVQGYGCTQLADLHLKDAAGPDRDPAKARDAFETGCQLHDQNGCVELARLYLSGQLVEPVAGRGQRLVDWLCANEYQEACGLKASK